MPPSNDYKSSLKKELITTWNEVWLKSSQTKGSFLFGIVPHISVQSWFRHCAEPRKFITTLGRLRTGHNSLPQHLHRIKVIDSAKCECNSAITDANHLLFECKLHRHHQNVLLNKLIQLRIYPPFNISHLLALNNLKIYKYLFNFFESINVTV